MFNLKNIFGKKESVITEETLPEYEDNWIRNVSKYDAGVCFYYPAEALEIKSIFELQNLQSNIISEFNIKYPNMCALNIHVDYYRGCINKPEYRGYGYDDSIRIQFNISWVNGIHTKFVTTDINSIIKQHCDKLNIPKKYYNIYVAYTRKYSDAVLLKTARKYSACINENLPINMHNIYHIKYQDISLFDLAVGELNLIDNIKE